MKHRSSNPPPGGPANAQNARVTIRRFAFHSLLLSLAFFVWWFAWPWLSVYTGLETSLQELCLGLPLWFWLSCVASLFLLFAACLVALPTEQSFEVGEVGEAGETSQTAQTIQAVQTIDGEAQR